MTQNDTKCLKQSLDFSRGSIKQITLLPILFLIILSSVNAVTVSPNVSFTAAEVNYTANQNLSVASITSNSSDFYLAGNPYCVTVYTSFFTTTRVCAATPTDLEQSLLDIQEGAKRTNAIIFSAFGILALAILIGAGFMIYQATQGQMDTTTIMLLVVAGIGLSIVIFAGFYILSTIANSIA